jgi:hypothetical protein
VELLLVLAGEHTLLEVGAEVNLAGSVYDEVTKVKLPAPLKAFFIIETKIGFLTIGYKGMAFQGNFIELDKIVKTKMVYGNPGVETRIEHDVTISLGGDSGFSLGGTGGYSKSVTEQKSILFGTTEKHPTTLEGMFIKGYLTYSFN